MAGLSNGVKGVDFILPLLLMGENRGEDGNGGEN